MSAEHDDEIRANLERAQQSIDAAQDLRADGYYDFAASRAYYAAFYAATAALLSENMDLSKHSGVIAFIHQKFVKPGRLSKEQGKALNWLFELRNIGDYGGITHASQSDAEEAVRTAQDFLDAIQVLLGK